MTDLRNFRKMARRPRPGRQDRRRAVIDDVLQRGDSLAVTPALKAELMDLSRVRGMSLSAVVRVFLTAHEGEMDAAFDRHLAASAERAERAARRTR